MLGSMGGKGVKRPGQNHQRGNRCKEGSGQPRAGRPGAENSFCFFDSGRPLSAVSLSMVSVTHSDMGSVNIK